MSNRERADRLSGIATMWTVIRKAHDEGDVLANDALVNMMQRYSGAVYRYLLACLRSQDAADEVFQRFALRTIQGAFRHADPERGRFRDYLKVSVVRLVMDYRRQQAVNRKRSLDGEGRGGNLADPLDSVEPLFEDSWRDELLARAWAALQTLEEEGGQPYHSALNYRAQLPNATSDEMARDLTAQLQPDRPLSAPGVRKTLQRARDEFANILLNEVRQTLGNADSDSVEQELVELGLHSYCHSAITRRRSQ